MDKDKPKRLIIQKINIRPKWKFFKGNLFEYDISSAGFSMLRKAKVLDPEEEQLLLNENKMARNVYIGNRLKENPELIDIVDQGLLRHLNKFAADNGLASNQILTVKRDSLFITKKVNKLEYGVVKFRLANKFSGFFLIPNGVEVYYKNGLLKGVESIEIKGISDEKLALHQDGILTLIKQIITNRETLPEDRALRANVALCQKYLCRDVPVQCFREMNRMGGYRLEDQKFGLNGSFILAGEGTPSDEFCDKINIMYNYFNVLVPLTLY